MCSTILLVGHRMCCGLRSDRWGTSLHRRAGDRPGRPLPDQLLHQVRRNCQPCVIMHHIPSECQLSSTSANSISESMHGSHACRCFACREGFALLTAVFPDEPPAALRSLLQQRQQDGSSGSNGTGNAYTLCTAVQDLAASDQFRYTWLKAPRVSVATAAARLRSLIATHLDDVRIHPRSSVALKFPGRSWQHHMQPASRCRQTSCLQSHCTSANWPQPRRRTPSSLSPAQRRQSRA